MEKPNQISETDALKLECLQLQLSNLELQKQVVQSKLQSLVREMNATYGIGERDKVNLATRQITRAPE